MKRILSAVTSLTMGISILTSAFAVPFSTYAVSEASSFAEQSVITANDKVAAKNASSADALQWSIDNVKQASYKAGDVIYVDVFVTNAWGTDPDKEGIRGLQAFIDYDKSAFELVEIGESCYGATESSIASAGITVTLSNSTGLGTIAEKGDTVTYFGFKVKSGAKDGTYPITWVKDDTVVTIHPGGGDDNVPPTLADVDLVDGSIILGDGGSVVTTTAKTTTKATTTKPNTPVGAKLQWSIGNEKYTDDMGSDIVYVPVNVTRAWGTDPDTQGIRGLQGSISYDETALELVEISASSCYGNAMVNLDEKMFITTFSNASGLGTIAKQGDEVTYFGFKIKSGAKPGVYPIKWDTSYTSATIHPGGGDDNVPPTLAELDLVDGSIEIVSSVTPGVTTTAVTQSGEIGWVIPTVTAKPGDTVTMDVTVDGTDVAVAGYEGAIAHAAGVDYAGVASGDAYGAEMIDNGEKLLAFATPDGLNKIAAEKATVFTLTYNVPDDCKAGKYPITWENAFIVDENGNDITSLINLIDGAIIIEDVVTTASQPIVTTTTVATSSAADTSTTAATTTKDSSTTTAATTVSQSGSTATVTATTPQNSSTTTAAKTTSGVVSTTTAATTSNGGSTTTTGIVIPADAIGWIIPTVTAAHGQTVSMNVYVKGNAVGVAGMEGAVNWTSPIGFSGISDRSEAYDADVIYNPEENLIAFGRANGLNKIAEDGSYVFTLTYTVPEDCASGKYPITWDTANTFISDENGNKVPVVLVDGAIIVTPKTTTQQDGSTTTVATTSSVVSTTTAATTTPDVVSSTTAATTTPSVVSSTTAATTTPGVVSTTPAATTSQGGSVTTTAISIPTDTIGWVIPTVTAVPGQTVTMNVYVKGSSVGVAGMEGIINWTSPIGFSGISDRSEAYDADVVYNPEENIIAFGRNSGLNKIAEDGSYVFTLTYTVPEDCESGIYPVSWDSAKTYISDENGNKVPVVLIDGAIIVSPKTTTATTPQGGSTTTVTETTPQGGSTTTASATTPQGGSTTTVTVTTPQGGSTTTTTGPVSPGTGTATSMIGFFAIDSEIETTYGFYFSHDTNEFNKGQIIKVIAHCTFQKEDGTIEESDVDLTADIGFNGQTPYSMFKKSLGNVYEVPLYYGDEPLTYEDGSPVTVLALIGVKGDADLNNTVDAIDASNVLTYYAQKQTGVESPVLYQGPTDVLKGVNEKFGNVIKGLDQVDVLDELACFLADVDVDEYSADNWKTHKGNRAIDAIDASNILSFYAKVQTGSPADSATWDEVLGR